MASTGPIRVLIVDDSMLFRELMQDILSTDSDIEVVGSARDGKDALLKIAELHPDIITLDVHMPGMDGLETLSAVFAQRPLPVIMVSSVTERGADMTLRALELGALDYVLKPIDPNLSQHKFSRELVHKIKTMASADVERVLSFRRMRSVKKKNCEEVRKPAANTAANSNRTIDDPISRLYANGCVAIGVSTGGPPALVRLREELKPPMPPIVIVQHMPENFTTAFAKRLNSISELNVLEARTGAMLQPNSVVLAAGGQHLGLVRRGSAVYCRVWMGDLISGHRPSVDVMMQDAAQHFGEKCLGVIMTGMGKDGVIGCGAISAVGGTVIGQDQDSSDVYGMNKAAFLAGHVQNQYPLKELAAAIRKLTRSVCRESATATN